MYASHSTYILIEGIVINDGPLGNHALMQLSHFIHHSLVIVVVHNHANENEPTYKICRMICTQEYEERKNTAL